MTGMRDQTQLVPPDAEIVARKWALEQSIITDICSTNIATRLPRNASLPFLLESKNVDAKGTSILEKEGLGLLTVLVQIHAITVSSLSF